MPTAGIDHRISYIAVLGRESMALDSGSVEQKGRVRRGRVFADGWEPLMVKISSSQKSDLNDIARWRKLSMSEIVRGLLREYIEENRVAAAAGLSARLDSNAQEGGE